MIRRRFDVDAVGQARLTLPGHGAIAGMNPLDSAQSRIRGRGLRVVFPESTDDRVVAAAARLRAEGLAEPILLRPAQVFDGVNLGSPTRLRENPTIGGVPLPARGVLAIGQAMWLETLVDGVKVRERGINAASGRGLGSDTTQATEINETQDLIKRYLREMPVDPVLEKAEWDPVMGEDTTSSDGDQGLVDVKSKAEGDDDQGTSYSEY